MRTLLQVEYLEYICVDEMGNLIKPSYVTYCFSRILRDNNLCRIRFHDLRHSCASLLLVGGVPMKQIQEWLGHSDFSTTANIYAHLDFHSKLNSADAMLLGLDMGEASETVIEEDEHFENGENSAGLSNLDSKRLNALSHEQNALQFSSA